MAKVTLQRLHKSYPDKKGPEVVAVKSVSLEIQDGEFMVLVGPSGCGKSTTLRMIAGLEEITSGTLTIGDRVMNEVLPKDRDIAMVFQNYALYPHLSVYDNMAFGLKLRKFARPEIDRRVRDAAKLLGLEEMLERRPKALSGGQRQRVAVGRAIVRQPKVFLFDEPLSNLDAKMRVQMRAEISKLHDRLRATMIYVTHDQVEAMTMGDRICVMRDGEIMQVADPMTLYRRPANAYVAGFIGSPAMNLIRGEVRIQGGSYHFHEQVAPASVQRRPLVVPLNAVLRERVSRRSTSQVILGLRPENIVIRRDAETTPIELEVELTEKMGAEAHVHFRSGEHTLIARLQSDTAFEPGTLQTVQLELTQAHLFDAITGQSLAD